MSGKFRVDRAFLRTNLMYSTPKPNFPKMGQIIVPDKEKKAIAVWPSQNPHFLCITKITNQGKAATNKNFSGTALTCFLHDKPGLGDTIQIVGIGEKSVTGKVIKNSPT